MISILGIQHETFAVLLFLAIGILTFSLVLIGLIEQFVKKIKTSALAHKTTLRVLDKSLSEFKKLETSLADYKLVLEKHLFVAVHGRPGIKLIIRSQ